MYDWVSASLVVSALGVSYTIVRNLTVDTKSKREAKERAFSELKATAQQTRNDFDTYKAVTTQQIELMMGVVMKSNDMHISVATLVTTQKHFETQLIETKASIKSVADSMAQLTQAVLINKK